MVSFRNVSTIAPTSTCISACVAHLEGLHVSLERRYNDPLIVDYPLWFKDLEDYLPGHKNVDFAEIL